MSRLDDAANSVPAGSLPVDEDPNLEPAADAAANDPEPTGKQGDDGEPAGEKKDDRSLKNVQSEFQRKFEKLQATNDELMAELRSIRSEVRQPDPAPAQNQAPQTMDDMSISQLEQMRPNVPDEQKSAFEMYLVERKADARVDEKLNNFTQAQSFKTSEQKANEKAFARWPSLHDKSSDFYKVTNRILQEMGTNADNSPRAVLDAANEAGLELSLQPATFKPQIRRDPGNIQSGRTNRPVPNKGSDSVDVNSDEQKVIQNRLANAMPGREFTKEQLDRIAKRSKLYAENKDLFTRG